MRRLTFKTTDLMSAMSFVYSAFENFQDTIATCSVSHQGDSWPVSIVMEGPRSEDVYDLVLKTLTSEARFRKEDG